MGMPPFAGKSCYTNQSSISNSYQRNEQAPNPSNFNILRIGISNNSTVALIRYHNCSNYEGNKILVWPNINPNDLLKLKTIDPHFSEHSLSPIARFKPDDRGWELAMDFAGTL